MSPEEAFDHFKNGEIDDEEVKILSDYLVSQWKGTFHDDLSKRVASEFKKRDNDGNHLSKKEKGIFISRLAEKIYSNALFEALEATRNGLFNDLKELDWYFGIYLHYWLLRATIKDFEV